MPGVVETSLEVRQDVSRENKVFVLRSGEEARLYKPWPLEFRPLEIVYQREIDILHAIGLAGSRPQSRVEWE